ncbi:hypothetical protein [Thermoleptolyngbya sp. M55_K2018_002]|uniref:hypothetical protein n=1 Tax=Thermoleptolyngbya sp. M55_K2018_002 TaxID=2747808 RepID=UPI0019F4DF4B|nr:hypothetical protein [Thermoleptolyngbya sp. M55_K2018_002]HIK43193.1 hypothetical protein [Thermoleptolyngbya sp. M55_K2018_002]
MMSIIPASPDASLGRVGPILFERFEKMAKKDLWAGRSPCVGMHSRFAQYIASTHIAGT